MPRTVVYGQRAKDVYSAPNRSAVEEDNYLTRLAKLVPAEVLAFFVPAAAQWGDDDALLVILLVLGTLATPAYLWRSALRQPDDLKPYPHYYALATVAFLAWALGVSAHVPELLGLSVSQSAFAVTIAAFALPLADGLLADLRSDPT